MAAPQIPNGFQQNTGLGIFTAQSRTIDGIGPTDLWWNFREVPLFGNVQMGNMLAWMKKSKIPIITSRAHPDYPNMKAFPLEKVVNEACGGMVYFDTTPSYMVPYAIWKGAKSISCFGLDYDYHPDFNGEKGRACVEYWLGVAYEKGIDILIEGGNAARARVSLRERQTTSSLRSARARIRALPIRPVPPVTNTFIAAPPWQSRALECSLGTAVGQFPIGPREMSAHEPGQLALRAGVEVPVEVDGQVVQLDRRKAALAGLGARVTGTK